jgi:hypothetical protein
MSHLRRLLSTEGNVITLITFLSLLGLNIQPRSYPIGDRQQYCARRERHDTHSKREID